MTGHAGAFCTQSHRRTPVRTTAQTTLLGFLLFSQSDKDIDLLHNWYSVRLWFPPTKQTESMLHFVYLLTLKHTTSTCSKSTKRHTDNIHTHAYTHTQQERYTLKWAVCISICGGIVDNMGYFIARKVGRSCGQRWEMSVFILRSALQK